MTEIIDNKYLVIKRSDIEEILSDEEKHTLSNICLVIENHRLTENKLLNRYLVCNRDESYAKEIEKIIIENECIK